MFENRKEKRLIKKIVSAKRRGLFPYIHKDDVLVFDPLLCYKKLKEFGIEKLDDLLKNVLQGDENSVDKFLETMKHAFGVEPIDADGFGFSVTESIMLIARFYEYLSEVKKNISLRLGYAQSTDSPSPNESKTENSTEEKPANSPSDSTSISSPQAPPPVSPPSTEQEAPSTD